MGASPNQPPGRPLLVPGSLLGPYEIRRLLGVGGMGQVYEGFDARLNRGVAIKVSAPFFRLDPHLASVQQEPAFTRLVADLEQTYTSIRIERL